MYIFLTKLIILFARGCIITSRDILIFYHTHRMLTLSALTMKHISMFFFVSTHMYGTKSKCLLRSRYISSQGVLSNSSKKSIGLETSVPNLTDLCLHFEVTMCAHILAYLNKKCEVLLSRDMDLFCVKSGF